LPNRAFANLGRGRGGSDGGTQLLPWEGETGDREECPVGRDVPPARKVPVASAESSVPSFSLPPDDESPPLSAQWSRQPESCTESWEWHTRTLQGSRGRVPCSNVTFVTASDGWRGGSDGLRAAEG